MPETFFLTLNGIQTEATQGETLLQVARRLAVEIPTLCHLEGKTGLESCGVCMVEVEGSANVLPACASKAQPGMVVHTDTPALRQGRRMALELLLSDHLGDCNAPCELACPADIDIPEFIRLIRVGKPLESLAVILRSIAFPGVLGRICPKFCEEICRRADLDEPISICALKRYPADATEPCADPLPFPRKSPSGKKVGVVGAGIVGLTAAYYLLLEGHECVLYEAADRAGGALRNLIPEFRLPAAVTTAEVERIARLGARIETGKALGRDFTLEEIRGRADAVLLAFGANKEKLPVFEGSALGRSAAQFLESVSRGDPPSIRGNALVFGSGATALDTCRTLLRLGASEVTLSFNSPLKARYFFTPQIEDALAEGVRIRELTDLIQAEESSGGRLRCTLKSGEDQAVEEFESLFLSGHLEPDLELMESFGLKTTKQGIQVDRRTLMTSLPGVFAAGNIAQAGRYAVHGSAAGRLVAGAISRFLAGNRSPEKEPIHVRMHPLAPEDRETLFLRFPKGERTGQAKGELSEGHASFAEVVHGFPEEAAVREAARCLQCDCAKKSDCLLRLRSTEYDAGPKAFPGARPVYSCDDSHEAILYESGKCIKCGRCIAVAEDFRETLGLTYIGRGFDVRVGVPFGGNHREGLQAAAVACAEACPTGALARRR